MVNVGGNNNDVNLPTIGGSAVSEITVDGSIVWEDAFFQVQNISAPNQVNEGQSFSVSADVVNEGDQSASQSVSYNRGGNKNVSLSGKGSTNIAFSDSIGSSGTFTLQISSNDDSASRNIDIIAPTVLVDSFEDQDLSEYSNSSSRAGIVTDHVTDGNYSLALATNNDFLGKAIISTSGLGGYPQPGDTIQVDYYAEGEDAPAILFGESGTDQDDYTGYYYFHNFANRNIGIRTIENGSATGFVFTASQDFAPERKLYRVTIDWGSNGFIDVDLKDFNGNSFAGGSGSDSTYGGGAIGFANKAGLGNDQVYFDNFTFK